MNLDSLLPNLGEWLRGTGPESDVVVSTRIRLARNLVNVPFTSRANNPQKHEIATKAREAELRELRKQMQAAAAAERYEEAARLRDLIRQKEASDEPG